MSVNINRKHLTPCHTSCLACMGVQAIKLSINAYMMLLMLTSSVFPRP